MVLWLLLLIHGTQIEKKTDFLSIKLSSLPLISIHHVCFSEQYGTLSCHLLVKSEKNQEVGVAIFICVSHETMYRGRVCRGGIWSDGSVTFLIVFVASIQWCQFVECKKRDIEINTCQEEIKFNISRVFNICTLTVI